MKNLTLTLLFLLIGTVSNFAQNETKPVEDPITITVDDFQDKAESLIGKQIYVTGTVDHVCKHGGRQLELFGKSDDVTMKIKAGKITKFQKDIEGEDIKVFGTVNEKRIGEEYLIEWEEEVKADHKPDEDEYKNSMKRINSLREKIKKSDKGYLSYFSIETESYKVVK